MITKGKERFFGGLAESMELAGAGLGHEVTALDIDHQPRFGK